MTRYARMHVPTFVKSGVCLHECDIRVLTLVYLLIRTRTVGQIVSGDTVLNDLNRFHAKVSLRSQVL